MLVVGSAMYRRPLAETLTSVPFPSSNERPKVLASCMAKRGSTLEIHGGK